MLNYVSHANLEEFIYPCKIFFFGAVQYFKAEGGGEMETEKDGGGELG